MTDRLIPNELNYETWIEQIDLSVLVDEVGDLSEYVPYLKYVVGAYHWIRTSRAKRFLKALSKSAENLDEHDRLKLHNILESKEGAEILADYVKATLNTSSMTAIVALAILYSDVNEKTYSPGFKLSAVTALEGISEQAIDAFLALSEVKAFISQKNLPNVPYPVAAANDGLIESLSSPARELLRSPEPRVVIISDLIRRGLLLPDFASARLSDGGVGLTFGVTGEVKKHAELIRKAKQLLPKE